MSIWPLPNAYDAETLAATQPGITLCTRPGMAIPCWFLADLPLLIPCGAQFVIGGVLEPEQGVVGAGHGWRISSSLRRVARWWRAWVCWMTKTMASPSASH